MRFKYLKLRDWGPFKGTHTISFTGTLIGILGHNGSGKSTVVEALYSVITGKFRKYDNLIDFVFDLPGGEKAKSGSIEIGFDHGDLEVIVRRTISISKTKSGLRGSQAAVFRSRQSASEEWFEATGANAVNREIQSLLGEDVTVLGDYAFIEQGEITAIVNDDPSERTKALHKLFGLKRFEKIWEVLGQELSTIPDVKVSDDIPALRASRDEAKVNCSSISTQLTQVQQQLDAIDAGKAQTDIDRWDQSQGLQTQLTAFSTTVDGARSNWTNQQKQEATAQENVNRLTGELAKVSPHAAAAQNFLNAAQAASQAMSDQARLAREAHELVGRIKAHQAAAPTPPVLVWTEEQNETLSSNASKLGSSANFVGLHRHLLDGDSVVADCPMCNQPIADLAASLSEHRQVVSELQPIVADLTDKKTAVDEEANAYALARARYDGQMASLQQQAIEIRTEMEDVRELVPADPEMYSEAELAKRRASIAESHSLQGALNTASTNLATWKQQSATAKENLDVAVKECNALQEQLDAIGIDPNTFTPAHIENCRQTVKLASSKREEQIRLEEQHKLAQRTVDDLEVRIGVAQNLADQAEKANMARQTLNDARDLFHRDNIPMLMARRYLQAVDQSLVSFLQLMQSNFTAGLVQEGDSYQFLCMFPDSSMRYASNLSGGQKVRFSLSFLMAVNEVLASRLGVLALDEPTDQLDDDNIQHLNEVLTHVQQFAHSAGVQIFVITHDKQLGGSFDQTIRIEGGRLVA